MVSWCSLCSHICNIKSILFNPQWINLRMNISRTHSLGSHTRKASSHSVITSQFVVKLWKMFYDCNPMFIPNHQKSNSQPPRFHLSSLIHLKDVVEHHPHTHLNNHNKCWCKITFTFAWSQNTFAKTNLNLNRQLPIANVKNHFHWYIISFA